MYRSLLLGVMICGSLALSGCGGEQAEESSEINAETTAGEETVTEITPAAAPIENEIPASVDQDELARYGACLAILSSMNNIINNQPEGSDPTYEMIRGVNAHQATIYRLATAEIINSAPAATKDRLLEITNRFMKDKLLNQYVSMNQLLAYKNDMCETQDMTKLEANRLMEEYGDAYESEQERIKNIRL